MAQSSLIYLEEEIFQMKLGMDFKRWNKKKGFIMYHCINCGRDFGAGKRVNPFLCIFCGEKQMMGVNDG